MKPRRKIHKRTRTSPYEHLWPELAYMPELDHWPDRPIPFEPDRSQVLNFIVEGYRCDLREAECIFRAARHAGVIRFNQLAKLWCGAKGDQP